MTLFSSEFLNNSTVIAPALGAGFIILLTHIPLGSEVLKRGIVFIDLAIAQMASLGVIVAASFGFEPQSWGTQFFALGMALFAGIGLAKLEKITAQWQEALIGILFILSSSLGVILLANNPHGGEELKELLVGQILWVTPYQLFWNSLIHVVLCGLFIFFQFYRKSLPSLGFHLMFAIAITFSVQLIGVYLVFSSLIIPALATLHFRSQPKRRLLYAYTLGGSSYFIGLLFSAFFDLPAGALIVWAMALISLCFFLFFRSLGK